MKHRCAIRALLCTTVLALLFLGDSAWSQQIVVDSTADGSLYEFVIPNDWNGWLVVYAHGITDPQAPIALPSQNSDFGPFRDALVSEGYAVASSSWSENGYALKDGVQRIHQLNGLFTSRVSPPSHIVLVGKSLGGGVVIKLAEQFPSQYSGALAMCGTVGGGTPEVKYLADVRILFDHFFPGVVPGNIFNTPTLDFSPGSPTFNAVLQAVEVGFFVPSQPTLQFASSAKLQASDATELVTSALEGVGFSVRFSNDLMDRTHGHIPYDNTAVSYTGSADDTQLNQTVERFTSTPDAVNYVARYYDPTGHIQIPVLTLHNLLDPVAPIFHEQMYAGFVAQAGASNLLVQQSVTHYDHCTFSLQEKLNAFHGLAAWIANPANKPAGGDVTLP